MLLIKEGTIYCIVIIIIPILSSKPVFLRAILYYTILYILIILIAGLFYALFIYMCMCIYVYVCAFVYLYIYLYVYLFLVDSNHKCTFINVLLLAVYMWLYLLLGCLLLLVCKYIYMYFYMSLYIHDFTCA